MQREDHAFLARWAVGCAERVLPLFARHSDDVRPGRALEIGRAWANNECRTGAAMKASVAAHAAGREVRDKAAVAAARAAGHAVATAHFADHCMGALLYALKAMEASGSCAAPELDLQLAKLPDHLRAMVADGVMCRLAKLGIMRADGRRSSATADMRGMSR